jgi:hypothetical protein
VGNDRFGTERLLLAEEELSQFKYRKEVNSLLWFLD